MTISRISIIIPVYNVEKFLDKCIQSIINQTYKNIEIILVNDGSTDYSLEICKQYEKTDDRVIVVNKENGGVSSARNTGLEIATGDYIGFVDADDYIDPKMYGDLLYAMEQNNADIAECGYSTTNLNYEIIDRFPLKDEIINGSYNCSRNYLSKINTTNFNVNKLYKKFLFNDIRFPSLAYSEDYMVNVKTFYKCNRKVTISSCYYYYLQNDASAVNKPFSKLKLDGIKAGKELFRFHQERYTDLSPLIALYITEYIIRHYKELKSSDNKDLKAHEKLLVKEFKCYYPRIKGDAYKLIQFKKRHIILLLFNSSPEIYCFIQKNIKKFKGNY